VIIIFKREAKAVGSSIEVRCERATMVVLVSDTRIITQSSFIGCAPDVHYVLMNNIHYNVMKMLRDDIWLLTVEI